MNPSRHNSLWERIDASEPSQTYYRSISELLEPEAAEGAQESDRGALLASRPELGRRTLLELLGASMALAGLAGCNQNPQERLLPYVHQPPEITPGVPVEYATTMVRGGFGTGLLAKAQDGRPIKLDGNPDHPASMGGSMVYEQAAVLGLYDPSRLPAPLHDGDPSAWPDALAALSKVGARTWFVLPPQTSPLVGDLIERIGGRLPGARFAFHSAFSRREVYAASRLGFGRALEPIYDLSRASVVLALDADFLCTMPGAARFAHDFAKRRRLSRPQDGMNRLYVAEAMLSPTGSLADHRLALPSGQVHELARSVLSQLAARGRALPGLDAALLEGGGGGARLAPFAAAVAQDLADAHGQALVLVGERQPRETQLLGHALNAALGADGATLRYVDTPQLYPDGGAPLSELAAELAAGKVDALVILDENLALTAPAELGLPHLLARAKQSFHLTYHENETSRRCRWVLPLAHFLESWGDARAFDGTLSFTQPLIEPLYPAKSLTAVLAACAGQIDSDDHRLLTERYRRELGADFESEWERRLRDGFTHGSAAAALDVQLDASAVAAALEHAPVNEGALELNLTEGPAYDGRYVNNPWLLELPRPMTKQCWGNAAVLSPRTAERLGVSTGDVLALERGGHSVRAPALVLPGHADDAVSIDVGYGSSAAGLGRGVGVDAFPLRGKGGALFAGGLKLHATGEQQDVAITQEHFRMHGRRLALSATLDEYRRTPLLAPEQKKPQATLLPQLLDGATQWAMSIDTSICSGCSACVIACQAENNVPVVGKKQVMLSREMHWLRIDRYFKGSPESPTVLNQPMLCQHCEKAPCEYVCPVNATVHSPDGLNEMIYNRCIGTRFCSNNCPYKVRRFNWFELTNSLGPLRMQQNPDVTVRERGVMEKCSYCVQRIRHAERQARIERRDIAAGDVVTACQAACPTSAIQFGSLNHRDSEMVRWREQPRSYAVLHELGTRPRTIYLAKIENPNPQFGK